MYKKLATTFFIVFLFAVLVHTAQVFAQDKPKTIGVGVGIGKIIIDEQLFAGRKFSLPSFPVVNTGSQVSDYKVSISFHQDQKEHLPSLEWFDFQPQTFTLKPGEVQHVAITITLPLKTTPGDYFAYVEASPTKNVADTSTNSVNVAAAAKLFFTVTPSNMFEAVFYRILSIYQYNKNFILTILGIIITILLVSLIKSKLSFNITVKQKEKPKDHPDQKNEA